MSNMVYLIVVWDVSFFHNVLLVARPYVTSIYSTMSSKRFQARLQKRILLEAAALALEMEESDELDADYKNKFSQDFQNEFRFIASKEKHLEDAKTADTNKEAQKEEDVIHPVIKKLFREIAKKTHPDIFADEYIEEFKKANIAQENNDWVALLVIANDLNIELPALTEDVSKLIIEDIDQKKQFLEDRKDGLAWAWASSSDSSEDRRIAARRIMQIDEEEFQAFLKNLEKNS